MLLGDAAQSDHFVSIRNLDVHAEAELLWFCMLFSVPVMVCTWKRHSWEVVLSNGKLVPDKYKGSHSESPLVFSFYFASTCHIPISKVLPAWRWGTFVHI